MDMLEISEQMENAEEMACGSNYRQRSADEVATPASLTARYALLRSVQQIAKSNDCSASGHPKGRRIVCVGSLISKQLKPIPES